MFGARQKSVAFVLIGVLAAFLPGAAAGDPTGDPASGFKKVDGIGMYYAIMPAELIRGHQEGEMHGGIPIGSHMHHVMVALFKGATLDRITDAEVTASVGEVGLTPVERPLEPMEIANAMTYGNFFSLPAHALYKIEIEIRMPGATEPVKTTILFDHGMF